MSGGFLSRRELATLFAKMRAPALPLGSFAGGKTFFVNGIDGVGADGRDGDDPEQPMLTITAALAKCVANRGDVIIVEDYWQPTGEVWPILVNKHQVAIIGMAKPNLQFPAIHPPGATAAFEVAATGQYSEIAGFMIGGGAAHGGIETGSIANGMGNGLYLHDCWFGHEWFGTPLAGFRNLGTINACGIRIEKCSFFGDLASCTGEITATAIDNALGGAGGFWDYCEFINNIFTGLSLAIDLHRARNCMILGNKFACPDILVADGEAITLQATCLGCMVDGNSAFNGGGPGAMTNPPYRDLGTNHWGLNLENGVGITPTLI